MASAETLPAQVQLIPIQQLRPNPWNRTVFDPEALKELVASLRTGGIEEPLIVRLNTSPAGNDAKYQIASGHRRWLAAQKVGLKAVPCIVRKLEDKKVAEMNIEVNLQREDIPPLEMARMVKEYMDRYSVTQMQAAAEFGKSQAWVSDLTGFLKIPGRVLQIIRALIIGWDGLVALRKAPEQIQLQVSKELKNGQLKSADIVKRCQQLGARGPSRQLGLTPKLVDPLAKIWEPLRVNPDFTPDVTWDVQYKAYAPVPGQSKIEGWLFFAKPIIGDQAKGLAVWFRQMATALEGRKPAAARSQAIDEMQKVTDAMSTMATLMGQPRLPKNAGEEKQLLEIARKGTPRDVLEWIYGKADPRTQTMPPITWKEYGQSPKEGLEQIVDNIRAEQNRAKTYL